MGLLYKYVTRFEFITTDTFSSELRDMFLIQPSSGKLSQGDRGVQILVIFKPTKEILITEESALYAIVIEPSLGEGGETIARIPIKISAKSVYSK